MLSDLEHQLETASLASKKLNQDAKAKGLSRVGSSLRREFSAFRKVLENSKSRLQELEAMKADLERMDMREGPVPVLEPIEQDTTTLESTREPALELVAPEAAFESREPESKTPLLMTKAKSFNFRLRSSTRSAMTTLESTPEHGEPALKPVQMTKAKSFSRRLRSATQSVGKSVKSPHWLPSLGNKKKFFPEEESRGDAEMEREIMGNIRKAVVEREIEKGIHNTMEECRTDCPRVTEGPAAYKKIHDRVEKLRLALEEDEAEDIYENNFETDPLSRNRSGLSLEVRERSFRTNLQVRALALSRDHSAKVAMGLVKRADEATDVSGNNDTENKKEETLAEFASRLERTIKMMKASDLGAEALEKEGSESANTEVKDTPVVFQKDSLQSYKSKKEPMSLRIAKSLRLMRADSTVTVATANPTEDPAETSGESPALTLDTPTANKTEMGPDAIETTLTDVTGPKVVADDTVLDKQEQGVTNVVPQPEYPAIESRRAVTMPQQSFHADGWKDSEEAAKAADILSEEVIAAQELKAREAYIKAMQIHQELFRSGKREESPEVIESKRLLQKCFAKIEYWENMKENLEVRTIGFSQNVTAGADALHQIDGDRVNVSALKIEHYGFKVSQDTSFIEAQEQNAREDYINAMREHQELILTRVKANTFAWEQSQRRQKQALAKLKYWEARSEAATPSHGEQDEPNIMIAPARIERSANFQMSNLTIAEQIAMHDAKSAEEDDVGGNAEEKSDIQEDVATAPLVDSVHQDDEEHHSESMLGYVAATMHAWLPSWLNTNSCDCIQNPIPGLVAKSAHREKLQQFGKKSRNSETKATKSRTPAKRFPAGSVLCGGIDVVTLGSTEKMNEEFKKEHEKKTEKEAMDMLGSLTYDSFSVTSGATGEESLEVRQQRAGARRPGSYGVPSEEDDGSVVSFLIDGEAGGTKIFCM